MNSRSATKGRLRLSLFLPITLIVTPLGPADAASPSDFLFPLFTTDAVVVTVQAGGTTNNGTPDPNHLPTTGYYAVDFATSGSNQADVIAAKTGKIVAIGTGATEEQRGKCGGERNCIILDHDDGYFTEYREFSFGVSTSGTPLPALEFGAIVQAKTVLGSLRGSASAVLNEHLHFQVLFDKNQNGIPERGESTLVPQIPQLVGTAVGGKQLDAFLVNQPVPIIATRGDVSLPADSATGTASAPFGFGVGINGHGELTVVDGARFSSVSGPIGLNAGSSGTVTVSGSGSEWKINPDGITFPGTPPSSKGGFSIGGSGDATLTIKNGGTVIAQNATIGARGGVGSVRVSGPNSTFNAGTFLGVGTTFPGTVSGTGHLTVEKGGRVIADQIVVAAGSDLRVDGVLDGRTRIVGGLFAPGTSIGIAVIVGDFDMTDGVLEIEVAGLDGGEFDVLNVLGNARLTGGIIDFIFLDGFLPHIGDNFEFLTAFNSDVFGGVTFMYEGAAPGFEFAIGPYGIFTALNDATAVPEPGGLAVLVVSIVTLAVTRWFKSRSSSPTASFAKPGPASPHRSGFGSLLLLRLASPNGRTELRRSTRMYTPPKPSARLDASRLMSSAICAPPATSKASRTNPTTGPAAPIARRPPQACTHPRPAYRETDRQRPNPIPQVPR